MVFRARAHIDAAVAMLHEFGLAQWVDPVAVHVRESRVYRMLGQLDRAEVAIGEARRHEGQEPSGFSLSGDVELERLELGEAQGRDLRLLSEDYRLLAYSPRTDNPIRARAVVRRFVTAMKADSISEIDTSISVQHQTTPGSDLVGAESHRWLAIYYIRRDEFSGADEELERSLASTMAWSPPPSIDHQLLNFATAHLYLARGDIEVGREELLRATDKALRTGLVQATLTAHRVMGRYFSPED